MLLWDTEFTYSKTTETHFQIKLKIKVSSLTEYTKVIFETSFHVASSNKGLHNTNITL